MQMQFGRTTLSKFVIEQTRDRNSDLGALIIDVAAAVKTIAAMVAKGALACQHGVLDSTNIQGEVQKKLDVLTNEAIIHHCEWGGQLAGMASEEMDDPYAIPDEYPCGRYPLIFDPLDGSPNSDVNVSVGTIFSIFARPEAGHAEVHRILLRGGIFMYPKDSKDRTKPGRLRLLYEASPMAMLMEQAGGAASTGRGRILDVEPDALHQRVPVILGSKHEVERVERYHREHDDGSDRPFVSPLFSERSLFRD